MMKVVRQDTCLKDVTFEDLRIGDVYKDENGYVCIKIKDGAGDNAITYEWNEVGEWALTSETAFAKVTPIEADLVIK